MTEPNLDKILRRIAYWNGYDSAGEWERTGHEVKAQLEQYIANQVREARIEELEFAKPVFNGMCSDARRNQSYYVSKAIALEKRLKELGE